MLRFAALICVAFSCLVQDYPTPVEGDCTAHDFVFNTGEKLADLRLHHIAIGTKCPSRAADDPPSARRALTGTRRAPCRRCRNAEISWCIPSGCGVKPSDETRGHGTHSRAVVWRQYLLGLLKEAPAR